ncbi:MAG TPA: saccharopine dehydrogenase NADP-binding domain-containing protein [archaeon]|nr:saccharopine dehydrogenase NADP-binding domain-containing protein [archaeon]
MKIVVLGGSGGMGKIAVEDLFHYCKDCEITIVDRHEDKARKHAESFKSSRVKGVGIDVNDTDKLAKILEGNDVAINCVVYYLNLEVMKACLKAGVHYLDLGGLFHMSRKQLELNNQFKSKKLLAVIGCGSTPGITNVMARYCSGFFDKINDIHISFGDADFTKYNQPFVIPYTMHTLFDEFMMQPAVFTKGEIKMVDPMSGKTEIQFPNPVGKLNGFYTLHSELATFPSSFKNKGLKECSFRVTFPKEFMEKIKFLIDMGYASEKEINVCGKMIKPKDFTAMVMNQWLPKEGTKIDDLEYLRVEMIGEKGGKKQKKVLYCMNKNHKDFPAGSYNTGVAPSVMAQMIANGKVKERGVLPPELCIDPKYFFKELKKRGIKILVK